MYRTVAGLALALSILLAPLAARAAEDVCVVGGCYVYTCDAAGCSWVFVAKDPFDKDERQEN